MTKKKLMKKCWRNDTKTSNNNSQKQIEDKSIHPSDKWTKDILYEISDLEVKMHFLEYIKADYMLDANILRSVLFDYEKNQTEESKKEVERISNNLINSKDTLIRELIEYMNNMNALDHAIKIWMCQNE